MKKILLTVSLLICSQANADLSNERWKLDIGAGVSREPVYSGAKEDETEFRPYLMAEYTGNLFSVQLGIQNRLIFDAASGLKLWLGADPFAFDERQESDSKYLSGMGDVDGEIGLELGFAYQFTHGFELEANLLNGGDQGTLFSTDLSYELDLTRDLELEIGIGATWANEKHMKTIFGVTEVQASRSGYRLFTPTSGMQDVHLTMMLDYEINSNWSGILMVDWEQYQGDAADSPLVKDVGTDTNVEAIAGIIYHF
jgi:outer membrane scaffolding protein for murein synthesis (MipA/OmpV family)